MAKRQTKATVKKKATAPRKRATGRGTTKKAAQAAPQDVCEETGAPMGDDELVTPEAAEAARVAPQPGGAGLPTFNPAALSKPLGMPELPEGALDGGVPFVRMLAKNGKKVVQVPAGQVIPNLMRGFRFMTMEPATPRFTGGEQCDLAGTPGFVLAPRDMYECDTMEKAEMAWRMAIEQDLHLFPDHPALIRGYKPEAHRKTQVS
jgi:hypothetical protein